MNRLVIIKGGGDLATGIAHRLFRCGFDIVITEIEQPTVIRRSVAFANAIFEGNRGHSVAVILWQYNQFREWF